MLVFAGFFFRAYRAFPWEEPVAKIIIEHPDMGEPSSIMIIQDEQRGEPRIRRFEVADIIRLSKNSDVIYRP
jgi:hypothetical protein